MKIEDLEKLWAEDSKISEKDLAAEALRIPVLHQKWYGIFMNEKLLLMKIKSEVDQYELVLDGFFQKTLTAEELKANNLEYSEKKVLKPDIPRAINVHPKMIALKLKMGLQSEKCEFIKDILKMIHGRSFIIKDAIQWKIFQAGGN